MTKGLPPKQEAPHFSAGRFTPEEWQEYNRKVAEIRLVANITLDIAEQRFSAMLANEHKAYVDEATRIATEMIERDRLSFKPTQPAKVKEEKPVVEMTVENKKILMQLGEIQRLKERERAITKRATGEPAYSPQEKDFETEEEEDENYARRRERQRRRPEAEKETEEEETGEETEEEIDYENEGEEEGVAPEDEENIPEEPEPDEEYQVPEFKEPEDNEMTLSGLETLNETGDREETKEEPEEPARPRQRPRIFPPIGQRKKPKEMPDL